MDTILNQSDSKQSLSKSSIQQQVFEQITNGVLDTNKILQTLNSMYFIHIKSSYTYKDTTESEKNDIDYTMSILIESLLKLQSVN